MQLTYTGELSAPDESVLVLVDHDAAHEERAEHEQDVGLEGANHPPPADRPLLQPPAHVVEVLARDAQHRRLPQAQAGEAPENGTAKRSCLVNPCYVSITIDHITTSH